LHERFPLSYFLFPISLEGLPAQRNQTCGIGGRKKYYEPCSTNVNPALQRPLPACQMSNAKCQTEVSLFRWFGRGLDYLLLTYWAGLGAGSVDSLLTPEPAAAYTKHAALLHCCHPHLFLLLLPLILLLRMLHLLPSS